MDAKKLAAELKKIEDGQGRLTPEAVVKVAKSARHPLHGEFEWDNSIAGHRWRIQQARELINSVHVIIERRGQSTARSVAYVRDPAATKGEQGYRSVIKLRGESDEARNAVVREFAQAAGHLRRARDLAVVLGLADEVEDLIERVVALDQRVQSAPANA